MVTENAFDLTFLGTCACDFSRKLQGDCKDCFDFNARRSSAILMNGSYLIDCGMHTLDSLRINNTPTQAITDIFITHKHKDHFDVDNIVAIARGREVPLRVWIREDADIGEIENVTVIKMKLYERYHIGGELYVKGLIANHDENAAPQHFLFENCGKRFFYGCDGAWLINGAYQRLRDTKLCAAVFDCTVGDYDGDFRVSEHNSIPMLRLMLPSLVTIGAIDANTRVFLSHLVPSLHKRPHEEIAEAVKEFGAEVAYDGLRILL